jgi:hypothetical protein
MVERILYLIEKKADVNVSDILGMSPLHYLCQLKGENIASRHPDWPVPKNVNNFAN